MGNRLIIAAAGSGKTTYLCKEALAIMEGKILITTFTQANEAEICKKLIELHGCIPPNITVQTWFSFLMRNGVKPYQSVIYECDLRGLTLVNQKSGYRYSNKGKPIYWGERDVPQYYFDNTMRIYSDKIAKFVCRVNESCGNLIMNRLNRIYSHIFIDEVQDLAGYDLEIVRLLLKSASSVLMVGDPRQVTYHTHDEAKHEKYCEGKIEEFILEHCNEQPIEIDKSSLNTSYRNKQAVCEFANQMYPDFSPCGYMEQLLTSHDGVYFVRPAEIDHYLETFMPVQLRDNISVSVNPQYRAMNFGEAKGLTFERVLIYPTKPMLKWILNHDEELKAQSRSKLYVAVTRARHSVGIVYDNRKNFSVEGVETYHMN